MLPFHGNKKVQLYLFTYSRTWSNINTFNIWFNFLFPLFRPELYMSFFSSIHFSSLVWVCIKSPYCLKCHTELHVLTLMYHPSTKHAESYTYPLRWQWLFNLACDYIIQSDKALPLIFQRFTWLDRDQYKLKLGMIYPSSFQLSLYTMQTGSSTPIHYLTQFCL